MKNNLLKKVFQSIIYPTCFYFTVCIFITSIIAYVANQRAMAANLSFMGMLFAFSLFMSVINKIFNTKLNVVLKIVCHFFGTLISFGLVFVGFSGYYKNGQQAFFIIICMMVVYAIILSLIMLIRVQLNKKHNDKSSYNKQFGP